MDNPFATPTDQEVDDQVKRAEEDAAADARYLARTAADEKAQAAADYDGCPVCRAPADNPSGERLAYCWRCGATEKQGFQPAEKVV